ncbi:MAG: DUF7467 domain-containing protein [Candidatus Wenzhouxiangella sp. M2_3B_020]
MNTSTRFTANLRASGLSGLLVSAILAALPLSAAADELVVNGDFEQPNLSLLPPALVKGDGIIAGEEPDGWSTFFGENVDEFHCTSFGIEPCHGGMLVEGWTVLWQDTMLPGSTPVPGRLEIQAGSVGGILAAKGNQKAELDSHHRIGAGGVFDRNLNHNVVISQALPTCERSPYTLTYEWKPRTATQTDSDIRVLIDDEELISHTALANQWTQESYNFITDDDPFTPLAFDSFGQDTTYGMLLDNVSVQGINKELQNCEEARAVCGTKPAELELFYNGPDSDGDSYSQDPSEVEIETFTGGAPLPEVVKIRVYDHHYGRENKQAILFDEEVVLGETFSFSGTKGRKKLIPPRTYIEILDNATGDLLQRISFHTSCSQPLNLGDQFGGIAIWGFTP